MCYGRVVYLTSIRYCICNNAVYIRSANKSFKSGQTYQSRNCLCHPSALPHSSGFDHIFWTEISVLLSTVLFPLRHRSCLVFHRAHCCTVSFVHYSISDTIVNYSANHPLFANENQLQKSTTKWRTKPYKWLYQMTYKALQVWSDSTKWRTKPYKWLHQMTYKALQVTPPNDVQSLTSDSTKWRTKPYKWLHQMTYKALQVTPPNGVQSHTGSLQSYTDDIKLWTCSNQLKHNDDKTEAILFSTSSLSSSQHLLCLLVTAYYRKSWSVRTKLYLRTKLGT